MRIEWLYAVVGASSKDLRLDLRGPRRWKGNGDDSRSKNGINRIENLNAFNSAEVGKSSKVGLSGSLFNKT